MNIQRFGGLIVRQWIIFVAVLCIGGLIFGFAVTAGRKYNATAMILAGNAGGEGSAVLDPQKDPIESAISVNDLPNLLKSHVLLGWIGRDLHLTSHQISLLNGEITAKPSLGSDVIPITATDSDPGRAVRVANAATRELQRYEQQIAESRYASLITDLQQQLADRRATLQKLDDRVDAITGQDPYVSYQTGTDGIDTRLVQLVTQRDQLSATMQGDSSTAASFAQRPALVRDAAKSEIVASDPTFQNLHAQFGKDLALLTQQDAAYTKQFPGLAGYEGQLARERYLIAEQEAAVTANPAKSPLYASAQLDSNKADAAFASDRAQLAALNAQIAGMTSHLQNSGDESRELASLRRDREAGNQAYAQLSDRLAVAIADRSQAGAINTIVLLDSANSAAPALLSRPEVLATGLGVIFLWLAFTLAYFADASDSRLRARAKIEELYGTTVLGHVS